jgi:NADPH:quinone reductase-like Zn-dependent oxidoreductase
MGYDVVGEIDQLGDGVSGFQLGDRVADMPVIGSNAAYRFGLTALPVCRRVSIRLRPPP